MPFEDGYKVSVGHFVLSPVSCVDLVDTSRKNATDKNKNRLFLRYTKDEPQFWISLHEKNFDPTRWQVMHYGRYYEQIQSKAFIDVLGNSSKPRVIDVGGNIGWYSLLSAAMGAQVDVFEPNKVNFLRTCESICVNSWLDEPCNNIGDLSVSGSKRNGRVRIFPVGVGQNEGLVKFDTGDSSYNNPGQGKIVGPIKTSKQTERKYQEIRVIPLDKLATQLGWNKGDVDIMKLDVEGFELDVVLGAKTLLKSNRIKNIFMEGDVSVAGDRLKFKKLVGIIADSGYKVFKIGGFSGPTDAEVPPMDANIAEALTYSCSHKRGGSLRKKCNIWWKLRIED